MLRKCVLRSDTVKAASLPLASFITSAVTRATMSLISLSLAMLLLPEVELYARDYATPSRRNRAGVGVVEEDARRDLAGQSRWHPFRSHTLSQSYNRRAGYRAQKEKIPPTRRRLGPERANLDSGLKLRLANSLSRGWRATRADSAARPPR